MPSVLSCKRKEKSFHFLTVLRLVMEGGASEKCCFWGLVVRESGGSVGQVYWDDSVTLTWRLGAHSTELPRLDHEEEGPKAGRRRGEAEDDPI